MSFLSKLKDIFNKKEDKAVYLSGFKKSKQTFGDQLSQMQYEFKGVDDDFLEQLTIILLESDVGITTADLICEKLKAKCEDYPSITFHWAMNFLMEIMKEVYEEYPDEPIRYNEEGTTVILLEGVNGFGILAGFHQGLSLLQISGAQQLGGIAFSQLVGLGEGLDGGIHDTGLHLGLA